MDRLCHPVGKRHSAGVSVEVRVGDVVLARCAAWVSPQATTLTPARVAACIAGSSDLPKSGTVTLALTPWPTKPLRIEILVWRLPRPTRTTCLTFGHLAASDRTSAIEVFDQLLVPRPSLMPSVICLLPQKAVLELLPAVAMSLAAD